MGARSRYERPPILSRYAGFLLRALITIGALWYLAVKVPLGEVASALLTASPWLLLGGLGTQILLRVVNAARIRLIARAQGAPLSYGAILSTLFTTQFYGMMLPGSIGAGAATLVKYVGHGATLAAALVSMVVNRALDVPTTAMLGLFFWGLDRWLSSDPAQHGSLTHLLLLAPLVLAVFYAAVFGHLRLLQRMARLLQRPASAREGKVRRTFREVLVQLEAAGNLPAADAAFVIAVSISKELLGAFAVWCFARACGVELGFVTVAWMEAAIALLVLLPISLSGLGVREGALVLMSARFGIPASLALTWSLLVFAGIVFVAGIGGLLEARTLWVRGARAPGDA